LATTPRSPQAQHHRDQLERRRLRAAELFAAGILQAEVARQLSVSRQAVSTWHGRWNTSGPDALRSKGPTGPTPRLSDEALAKVEQALRVARSPADAPASCGRWSASRWSSSM
jgi:transposase